MPGSAESAGPGLRVLTRHDKPAPSSVVLVSSSSGKVLAIERGDDAGVVRLALEPGLYKVRVASPKGYAVREVDLRKDLIALRLDDSCELVAGVTSDELGPGDIAWLLTVPGGEYFGAIIDRDRTFRACVPANAYALDPDERLAPFFAFEPPAKIRFDAYKRERIEVPPPETAAPASHASIGELVSRNTVIIGIGEANHGSREFLAIRLKETLALARTQDVRYIALEAGAAEVFPLDDYVHGASVDVRGAVSKIGYWMWDTEEFIATLEAIRKYNASAAASERLTLIGVDVQTASAAAAYLRTSRISLSPQQRDALDLVGAADNLTQLPGERASTLSEAFAALTLPGGDSPSLRLELARLQIECRFAMLTQTNRLSPIVREEGMERMTNLLLEKLGANRAVLWAHNGHINTDPHAGYIPLGARLRAAHGHKYMAVGLLMGSGEFRAWDVNQKVGVVSHRIDAPPAFTLEAHLLRHFVAGPVFASLDEVPAELAQWISIPRRAVEVGGQMSSEWRLRNHSAAFDAIGFVPRVSPTTPTPTGVRKAS